MERYTAMYPRGQPGLPDELVTAYVNGLRATRTTSGTVTTRSAPQAPARDSTHRLQAALPTRSQHHATVPPTPNAGAFR
jgi:hypothetical protein